MSLRSSILHPTSLVGVFLLYSHSWCKGCASALQSSGSSRYSYAAFPSGVGKTALTCLTEAATLVVDYGGKDMAGFDRDAALHAVLSDFLVRIADCDPFCSLQACMRVAIETVMSEIDIFTPITLDHMKELKNKAFVGDTVRSCADAAMLANFAFLPSVLLVIMFSVPNVYPSVVDNKEFVFPEMRRPSARRATRPLVFFRLHHLHKRLTRHRYFRIQLLFAKEFPMTWSTT